MSPKCNWRCGWLGAAVAATLVACGPPLDAKPAPLQASRHQPLLFARYDARNEFAASGLVLLWLRRPAELVRCTGTLIAADRVLTEANCLPAEPLRRGRSLFVPAARPLPLGHANVRQIVEVTVHPDYRRWPVASPGDPRDLRDANLAVLRLAAPLPEGRIARLADDDGLSEAVAVDPVAAAKIELRAVSYAVHAPTRLLGRTGDERMVGRLQPQTITPWMVYAGHRLFSTGALTLLDGGSSLWRCEKTRWSLVGIRASQSDLNPYPEYMGAFVRLAPYLSWLRQQLPAGEPPGPPGRAP